MRLAIISDIHYGLYSRSDEFSVPGEAIIDKNHGGVSIEESFVKHLKEHDVRYLLVAGDLTSVGSPQEFHFCEERILTIAEKANIPHENVIIGLGNHDIDWRITKLHEEYSVGDSPDEVKKMIKDKYENISAHVSVHNMKRVNQPRDRGPIPFCGITEKDDIIFFVLNSGFQCAHDQSIKHGRLANEQLDWLKKNADKYIDDSRRKVMLLHHHPHNYPYHLPGFDCSTLEEGPEINDIAGKLGIDIVIHGHRHHPKAITRNETSWKKPMSFLCAGSFSVNSQHRSNGEIPNTFHVIELSDDSDIITLYNYQYKSSAGWIPLEKNCDETPLDYKMKLGRLVNDKELEGMILKLPLFNNGSIKWEALEEDYKCIPYKKLNDSISQYLSSDYTIFGKFPDDVFIMKMEGSDD